MLKRSWIRWPGLKNIWRRRLQFLIFPRLITSVSRVLPIDVQNAYYSSYGNHAEAEFLYNGKAFAFKDVLVDAWMIRDIDKGWIWADLCKCPIVNLADAKKFTTGDRIDIVGVCMGRNLAESPGLVFRDCYVMQAGSIQLPAPGSAGTFVAGY